MGRWRIRSLETRVGRESSVSTGGAGLYSGGIHVGAVGRGSHSVTAGGTAPRVRAAKSSEFGEESCEHLRWTHLEQAQHCTDLPRQVTFPVHTEQGKMGQGWDEHYRSSREREE